VRDARLPVVLVRLLLLASLVAPACAAAQPTAPGTRTGANPIPVSDATSFNAAIKAAQGGETIQLADGSYPHLSVLGRSFPTPVRIVGSRKAILAGITFKNSSNLVLKGVTITPPATTTAKIAIVGSSQRIVIDRVLVDGRDEAVGAFISTELTTADITVSNSSLTNCGKGKVCVWPNAQNLRIVRNRFDDCRSCDFIRGGGKGALIQGNSFGLTRNVECTGGVQACPHNNHIQIMGGGPWTIVGNSFGTYQSGPAQLYVNPGVSNDNNPIRDVLVASNLFVADSGVGVRIGVGGKSPTPPPSDVRVVNNTILTGTVSTGGAVLLHNGWDQVPPDQRPLFANNIFGKFGSANCALGRFVGNLVAQGGPCGQDSRGNPKLDPETHGPTAASLLVIDKATPSYAPETDYYGRPRQGPPDLGAIEFVPATTAGQIQLSAPKGLARSLASLAREGWRLRVTVGVRGADTLRGRLVRGGKTLTTVSARVSKQDRHTLVVRLPVAARQPGLMVLRLEAANTSHRAISRSVTVRIVRR
jgi:hypothetical protein